MLGHSLKGLWLLLELGLLRLERLQLLLHGLLLRLEHCNLVSPHTKGLPNRKVKTRRRQSKSIGKRD
jgi:hypothetical protein